MAQLIEFSINHWILVTVFFGLLALLIGSEVSRKLSGAVEISPIEATQKLNRDKAVLLDVRNEREYSSEHIIDALHIPQNELTQRLPELAKYKDQPVIVYCANGNRSVSTCARLRKDGFQQVFNLSGGLTAWQSANLPISKGG